MFVNFKNVQRTMRKKLPFGICQVGKSFRNEITPGNFIFRTREFEQMEMEFFCTPGTDLEWYNYWKNACMDFLVKYGVRPENLRFRDHTPEELSFYSVATCDIEYKFPFGWGELWGIADRTNYDLTKHMEHSKTSMEYLDPTTNTKYVPYCVEPAVGVERVFLSVFSDAYDEEVISENDTRVVMHLHPALAPIKACITPLTKKQSEAGLKLFEQLCEDFAVDFDDAGSIGKRYRRQDAIGTPFCITVDYDTENDGSVTVRDRDTMEQVRIKIEDLNEYISSKVKF